MVSAYLLKLLLLLAFGRMRKGLPFLCLVFLDNLIPFFIFDLFLSKLLWFLKGKWATPVRYHNPSKKGIATMNKFHWKEFDIPWRTLMPGVYIKTLRHMENKFAIHMLKVEAGFTEAPETHDADQYAYVLRGKAESHITISVQKGNPGSLYLFSILSLNNTFPIITTIP